ncbi:MAG: hypothetical protein KDE27_25795 [Planctomycetes bacterium]|nr:hypothetical protein [Planctomycetota bacterium]
MVPRPLQGSAVLAALLVFSCTEVALAQCATTWQPGVGPPGLVDLGGIDPDVRRIVAWDPDGPGPRNAGWVVAGRFDFAGDVRVDNLAFYDPFTERWSAIGGGVTLLLAPLLAYVSDVVVLPGGGLAVAGQFTRAGWSSVPARNVAVFDGVSWSGLGAGAESPAHALAVLPNGDLAVGGEFFHAGGVAADRIARWDGVAWHPLGTGLSDIVYALQVMPNGDLVATGRFLTAGALAVSRIARWDGTAWAPLGAGLGGSGGKRGNTLMLLPGGDLLVGGYFTSAGAVSVNGLARWDGTAWSAVGGASGAGGEVFGLARDGSGGLIVGGLLTIWVAGTQIHSIARWDGTSWAAIGSVSRPVHAVAVANNGDIFAGTRIETSTIPPVTTALGIARYDGVAWRRLNAGWAARVQDVAATRDGGLVAVGDGLDITGGGSHQVARWNGSTWTGLGNGPSGRVWRVLERYTGQIVVGGDELEVWNGATWSLLGPTSPQGVGAMLESPNGDLVVAVGGSFGRVLRWSGSGWSQLGPTMHGSIRCLATLPNGDLVAGGDFDAIGGVPFRGIARWRGAGWQDMDQGVQFNPSFGGVWSLATRPNGDLIVGGQFFVAGSVAVDNVARWDGATWHALSTGITGTNPAVYSLAILPNGDVLAGGTFEMAGGAAARNVARYDGSNWMPLAAGADDTVLAMTFTGAELAIGGAFKSAGGEIAIGVARLATDCAAVTTVVPTTCAGPAGPLELTAMNRPWSGSTFRSRAVGFAPGSVAVALVGLASQQLPLAQVLPLALPNCDLLVSTEAIRMYFGGGVAVDYELALPNTAAFAGLRLHHQFLELGVGSLGQLTSTSSSNALVLMLGTF